jgi:hypothetical protein
MGVAPEAIAEKFFPGIGSKNMNSSQYTHSFSLEVISPRAQGEVSRTSFDIIFIIVCYVQNLTPL